MAKKKSRTEESTKLRQLEEFRAELERETDRAAAILAVAYLDHLLDEILRQFFVDEEKEVDKLLDSDRPLFPLSAKIRAAYCLGLLSRAEYRDFETLREIRNKFAHNLQGISFSSASIHDKCMALRLPTQAHVVKRTGVLPELWEQVRKEDPRPRLMFEITAALLVERLFLRDAAIRREGLRRTVPSDEEWVTLLSTPPNTPSPIGDQLKSVSDDQ